MEAVASKIRSTHDLSEACPACGGARLESFYFVKNVPVNSCILMTTREEALSYPKGEISLVFCHDCGFVYNAKFDEKLIEYSGRYEETQGYSGTFNVFHRRLAEDLIERHDLHGKKVLEIGCGKGEFLTLLCDLGDNRGIGFDPSYVAERSRAGSSDRTTFVTDFYSKRYSDHSADFLCCKMTLEHIPLVAHFVSTVRVAVGDRETIVFFQVPEASIILEDCHFWDIYYEHCSYFDRGSLARLFADCGFRVLRTWVDYDDQYLMIEALPVARAERLDQRALRASMEQSQNAMRRFATAVPARIDHWSEVVAARSAAGKNVVLWGSGSKAVAFLTTLGIDTQIQHVVDINPHRPGMYMPGTGQLIVGPEFLESDPPDTVIIMNAVYRPEISTQLATMMLTPEILAL